MSEIQKVTSRKGVFQRVARNLNKMGYFRTDDESVAAIISHIQPVTKYPVRIFDPCCGEGLALADFKQRLENCFTYGIELDAERANQARGRLDHVVHASYDSVHISHHAFGCLFLNPPYGDSAMDKDGKTHRMEIEFLRRTIDYLAVKGLLIYIIPHTSLTGYVINMLSRFTEGRVYRAKDDRFNQLVIMAKRPGGFRNQCVDESFLDALKVAAETPEKCPIIPVVDEPVYEAPRGCPLNQFKPLFLSPFDVRSILEKHTVGNNMLDDLHIPQTEFMPPLMPVRDGHLGTMVSAGALDGEIPNGNDGSMYLKGSCFRVADTKVDKDSKNDVKREVTIHKSVAEIVTLSLHDSYATLHMVKNETTSQTEEETSDQ